MNRFLAIALIFTLAGCAGAPPRPKRDYINANIYIVDVVDPNNPHVYAISHCIGESCEILIRRDKYPQCITHEIRHGFEGKWHGNEGSTSGCRVVR